MTVATGSELAPYRGDAEVAEAITVVRTIADEAADLVIVDETSNTRALDMLSSARKAVKRIDGLKARWLDPLNAQIKLIRADFEAMAAPAREADAILSTKTGEYRRRLAEAAREQQERLARVSAVREAQARRAAEQGYDVAPLPFLAPTLSAPAKSVETDAGSKVTFRKVVHFEIVDEAAVPAEYWTLDERKVGAAVRAGVSPIAGVRIWTTEEPVVR
jgi:hypothetical protein